MLIFFRRYLKGETGGRADLTQVFVKLMNKGLRSSEHDKFPFETVENATVQSLIDGLMESHEDQFVVYFDDKDEKLLRRDTVVIVNGKNMVAHKGLATELSEGDLIVFMIAAVGG
ncbi:MAG: MoaD/ThiS family protein [Candidatus Thorarchaeota archaeon]|jgi:molybdopterin converting factor small subunit